MSWKLEIEYWTPQGYLIPVDNVKVDTYEEAVGFMEDLRKDIEVNFELRDIEPKIDRLGHYWRNTWKIKDKISGRSKVYVLWFTEEK